MAKSRQTVVVKAWRRSRPSVTLVEDDGADECVSKLMLGMSIFHPTADRGWRHHSSHLESCPSGIFYARRRRRCDVEGLYEEERLGSCGYTHGPLHSPSVPHAPPFERTASYVPRRAGMGIRCRVYDGEDAALREYLADTIEQTHEEGWQRVPLREPLTALANNRRDRTEELPGAVDAYPLDARGARRARARHYENGEPIRRHIVQRLWRAPRRLVQGFRDARFPRSPERTAGLAHDDDP